MNHKLRTCAPDRRRSHKSNVIVAHCSCHAIVSLKVTLGRASRSTSTVVLVQPQRPTLLLSHGRVRRDCMKVERVEVQPCAVVHTLASGLSRTWQPLSQLLHVTSRHIYYCTLVLAGPTLCSSLLSTYSVRQQLSPHLFTFLSEISEIIYSRNTMLNLSYYPKRIIEIKTVYEPVNWILIICIGFCGGAV